MVTQERQRAQLAGPGTAGAGSAGKKETKEKKKKKEKKEKKEKKKKEPLITPGVSAVLRRFCSSLMCGLKIQCARLRWPLVVRSETATN